jgi:hypothetical protein
MLQCCAHLGRSRRAWEATDLDRVAQRDLGAAHKLARYSRFLAEAYPPI